MKNEKEKEAKEDSFRVLKLEWRKSRKKKKKLKEAFLNVVNEVTEWPKGGLFERIEARMK